MNIGVWKMTLLCHPEPRSLRRRTYALAAGLHRSFGGQTEPASGWQL